MLWYLECRPALGVCGLLSYPRKGSIVGLRRWYSGWAWHPLRWEQFDKKYLSQLLMRRSAYRIRDQIWDVYYRLNIRDAISFVDQVCSGQLARQGLIHAGWQKLSVDSCEEL